MKSHIRYIICFLLILAWSISSHAFEQQDSSKTQFTILKAKGYVDVRNGKLIKPANIVMQQGLIKSINPKKLPDNSNVINLESMIILPGLIDVHTHLMIGGSNISSGDDLIRQARENSETDFVLGAMENGYKTLQAGFTTVRDLDSWYFVDVTLSKISQKKWSALPRIIPAGHGINKSSPADYSHLFPKVDSLPVVGIADNKSQLIEAVDAQYKAGARVIKLYATVGVTMADFMKKPIGAPMYTQEEMKSVMDEASKLGMKVAVHSHGANASMTAVLAGAASIEHGSVLTDKVIEEIQLGLNMPGTNAINIAFEKGWLIQQSIIKDDLFVDLNYLLDAGEASAICLAIHKNYNILIDEKKGRKVAKRYELKVIGSLAVLIKAKNKQIIPRAKPLLLKLKEHGYYISERLIIKILKEVHE